MTTNDPDVIVAALTEEWDAIASLCEGLSPAEWDTPTECPGWSVKDNVSHIIGTERALMGEDVPQVDIGEVPYIRNDIGRANEHWIQARRATPPAEVLAEFREVTSRRLEALRAMDRSEFEAPSWTPAGPDTYGRFMQIRVFDSWVHEQDIRQAVGRPGHDSGVPAEVVLDEISNSIGYVVGKKAGAPEGSRFRIALTGGVERELLVEVEGRARLVDQLSGPATAELRMPFLLFTRLCGGRTSPDAPLAEGTIRLGGTDPGLAEHLVRNLAYMI